MSKCAKCGAQLLAGGTLRGPTRLSFRPDGAKFLTVETGDVLTKAAMCHKCGFIEIIGDVNKLKRLTSGGEPGGGEAS